MKNRNRTPHSLSEAWRTCGIHKISVQNYHKKKFILKSDSGSKIDRFLPFGSKFDAPSKIKKG